MLNRVYEETLNPSEKVVIVISADWDGCFDVLFDELLEARSPEKEALLVQRKILNDFLDNIIKDLQCQNVGAEVIIEVYANSLRQYRKLDQIGHDGGPTFIGNRNGLCLVRLPQFCEKRGWLYRKLLLTDTIHEKETGSAFDNTELEFALNIDNKFLITLNHLCDIEKNHPGKKIYYCFFDNIEELLNGVQTFFNKERLDFSSLDKSVVSKLKKRFESGTIMQEQKLPENMYLHFTRFDWHNQILQKMACIHSGKLVNLSLGNIFDVAEKKVANYQSMPDDSTQLLIDKPQTQGGSFRELCRSILKSSCCFWNRRRKTFVEEEGLVIAQINNPQTKLR